jgi:hypothetical protein
MGFGWIFVIEWNDTKDWKPKNRKITFAKQLTGNDDENRKIRDEAHEVFDKCTKRHCQICESFFGV